MRPSLCWIGIVAVLGAGCGGEKTSPPADRGSAAVAADTVEVFVGDTSVGKVGADKAAAWPRVDSLVPDTARKLGTWDRVTIEAAQGKPTELARPSGAYPDMVPALFPTPGGGTSFGMFDTVELAKKGQPAMRVDHIKAIHIQLAQGGSHGQNDDQGGGAADPTKLTLSVTTAKGTTTLTGEQLIALPREPTPNNPDQKGWRLQQFLVAAGVTTFKRLVLTDASGTSLSLDAKDLAGAVPFIKLNKSGQLRFRIFKQEGEGWTSTGDLRGLTTIDVK